MSRQGISTHRVNQDWGGASDQRFAPTNRDRKKWKPFQQGRGNRGPRDAPKAPRAMSGIQHQQQAPELELQMQVSLPRLAEGALSTVNVPRPGPLPPDHPLSREMDELKATRKRRQFYWAGLIQDLGDDEWGNPANYDRQRWEEEERLADKKFEELAGQIKLVEMGFPLVAGEDQHQSRSESAAWGSDGGNAADAYRDRYSPNRRGTTRLQHRGRQHRSPPQHKGGGERPDYSFKGKNPNAPPRKEMFWTQQKRARAVSKWMDQMGMNPSRKPSPMELKDVVGGITSLSEHVAINEDPDQQVYFDDLRVVDSPYDHHKVVEHHEITDRRPPWIVLDELAFEEAERDREEERLQLGQYLEEDRKARHTIETGAASAPRPSRAASWAKQSEKELPRKQTSPSVPEPDIMNALMKSLLKGQVKSPNPIQQDASESSQGPNENNKTLDLTSGLVPDQHASSRTSLQRQSPHQPSSTDRSSQMASDISRKVNPEMPSSAVPEPIAPPETHATRQGHTRATVAADIIEGEETQIERLDMRGDISSEGSEASLHPEPYSDRNDEDGFIHIDDTPHASSPVPTDDATPTKPPVSSRQNNASPDFSALGIHYRNALRVNEMFSPAGTLLPPEPGSVAARLRDLRRPYDEYSSLIRRWAAARQDEEDYEGNIVVEGVSAWVNARIWLVDWRERLDMYRAGARFSEAIMESIGM